MAFHAIIVGECLPAKHPTGVSCPDQMRAFENGYWDSSALFKALGKQTRSGVTWPGIWLRNMIREPDGYKANRGKAIESWRAELKGPPTGGLFQAQAKRIAVLCTTNWVAKDLASAHQLENAIPCISKGALTVETPRGGVWQFALWYRTDIRDEKYAAEARSFLRL